MTDEEMAEEYKESRRLHGIPKERHLLVSQDERLNELKQAFLAGLKAGRPEWHKVADGDLPKEIVKIILVRDRYKNRFINYYLLDNKMIAKMIDQFDEWVELPIGE